MDVFHFVFVSVLIPTALTCSPEAYRFNIPLDEMAHRANFVVLGLVTKQYKSTIPHEERAFVAEFEVKCIYKGGQIPALINITNGGFSQGACGEKNFTVGVEYIGFLDKLDGSQYHQIFDETKPADPSLAELLMFCGLSVEYPESSKDNNICIPPLRDGCHTFNPPEPPQPPPPPFPVDPFVPPVIDVDPDTSGELPSLNMESTTPLLETKVTPDEALGSSEAEESNNDLMTSKADVMSYGTKTPQKTSDGSSSDTHGSGMDVTVVPIERSPGQELRGDAVSVTTTTVTANIFLCLMTVLLTIW